MSKSSLLAFFVLFCLPFSAQSVLWEIEELEVHYKKEILSGKTFVKREDVANGVKKQAWTIDGASVDEDLFEQTRCEAVKEYWRQKRVQELARREALQQERAVAVAQLHKKLLRLLIERVEVALKKFDDHRLGPFLLFDQSFSRDEFDAIEAELLTRAKQILYGAEDQEDLGLLAAMIEKLDGLDSRLHDLFQVTVNSAIKRCDDTRMLKDLLAIVST